MLLEICIDSIESAKNAIKGGATRLEICSSLSEGGLTPTPGLLKSIQKYKIPIYAMIRIRPGNFVYTREEIDAMLDDLKILKNCNVDGFVFGALESDNTINKKYCREIIEAAKPKPVTFHRAFDEVQDPFESLNEIINLGFERILTSGQKNTAIEGLDLIKQLVDKSDGKIVIMPGSGITCDNLSLIKINSGASEFHASAKIRININCGKNNVKIGDKGDDKSIMIASEESVRKMVYIINNP